MMDVARSVDRVGPASPDRLLALVQEMRMPVTPVKLQLELLLGQELAPEHRRSVEMLERNCTRFVALLDELEREVRGLAASAPA